MFLALKMQHMMGYETARAEPAKDKTEAVKLNIDKGQYLFATRCAACHTIGQGGQDRAGSARRNEHARALVAYPDYRRAGQTA
jgi:mono/diheme cytochrome c family protein